MNQSLTPTEVAEQLQIAKNTVYELIKRGELPAYKVGRKVRIDSQDLEAYKRNGKKLRSVTVAHIDTSETPVATITDSKSLVISGHDTSLDILASILNKEMPAYPILRAHTNSYRSLIDLYLGKANIAATHLWDAQSGNYNIAYAKMLLPSTPVIIINIAKRTQGLFVYKNNPKNIHDWSDLAKPNVTMINREKGSGSRILLDEKLQQMYINTKDIEGYNQEAPSGTMAATYVSGGKIDCAVGCEHTVRNIEHVDFIPLQKESYDIVIKKENMSEIIYKVIYEIINSEEFIETIHMLSNYDVSMTGEIIYETGYAT